MLADWVRYERNDETQMNFEDKFERREPAFTSSINTLQIALVPFLQNRRISHLELLAGGYSNTNFKMIVEGAEKPFVLRISEKPRSEVEAELSVMELVKKTVPAPSLFYTDLDNSILGKHILILEFIDGESLHQVEDTWTQTETEYVAEDLGRILASIHEHKFSFSGLFGPNLSSSMKFETFGAAIIHHMLDCLNSARELKRLDEKEAEKITDFIQLNANVIEPVQFEKSLVHSDFNQKNILVTNKSGRWKVAAVLDWEFAFSGSPIMDFGNFFRFEEEISPHYRSKLIRAYKASGGTLPDDWRKIAKYIDIINMMIFLSNKEERPKTFATALKVIRETIQNWREEN